MVAGETISAWMWSGPGSASLYTSATQLTNVVVQIWNILDGQQANAGAVLTAWASPTGDTAVAANSPYQTWLADAAGQIETAAVQIQSAATAFEGAQKATPHPAQFAAIDSFIATWAPLSFIPPIGAAVAAALLEHFYMTLQAQQAYAFWTAESAATVGALEPLPTPPATAVPAMLTPFISTGLVGQQPIAQVIQGVARSTAALPSVGSVGSAAAQPVSGVASLASQPTSALLSSGSELTQAPASMASSLGSVPSMASGPMSALGSPSTGSGSAGVDSLSWLGASAGGGTVAASLSGGGAGLSGLAGSAALAPVRGPVSWASTAANPTPEAEEVTVSRIAEAKAASGTGMPATSGGMGAPGAMAPAARQTSESERERGLNNPLAAAAVLYRPPRNMPVVTGAAGAQFVTGREAL